MAKRYLNNLDMFGSFSKNVCFFWMISYFGPFFLGFSSCFVIFWTSGRHIQERMEDLRFSAFQNKPSERDFGSVSGELERFLSKMPLYASCCFMFVHRFPSLCTFVDVPYLLRHATDHSGILSLYNQ